jgi:hypothetical protein
MAATPHEFAIAVFAGEGLNPAEHKHLFRTVRARIERHFELRDARIEANKKP